MRKTLENIQNHIIIVGYGRVGKLTVEHLINAGEDCVIVDDKIDTDNLIMNNNKKLFVHGDATEDTVLNIAGIERAKGLIVTLANPADDVFVILTAKEINPKIYIVARADNEKDISKMMKAGADRIVNPYNAGGERMSNLMLNRNVVDFFKANLGENLPELAFETIELPDDCPIIGKSLLEIDFRKKTKATILGIVRDGNAILNPTSDMKLFNGDKLLIFGKSDELKKMESIATTQWN